MVTPTPNQFENASHATNSFATAEPLIPVVLLVGVAALALVTIAPALAEHRVIGRIADRFGTAFAYAIKGLLTVVVLGVLSAPVTLLATADPATRTNILEYAAIGVGAFVGLAVVGYIADYAVTRYINAHPEYEEWGDIWPDADGEEVAADGGETQ